MDRSNHQVSPEKPNCENELTNGNLMELEDQRGSSHTSNTSEVNPRKDKLINTPPTGRMINRGKSSMTGQDRKDVHCISPGGGQLPWQLSK